MRKNKLLIVLTLIVFAGSSIANESYTVVNWFKILPKNSNLNMAKKIAKRKKLRANIGDKITLLKNTGYEFEDNGYIYFSLTRKGEQSPSGIYFVYRKVLKQYIRKKSLKRIKQKKSSDPKTSTPSLSTQKTTEPPSTSDGSDKKVKKISEESPNEICEKLSKRVIRFSEPTEVYFVSGKKKGPDNQVFTNRSAFKFEVKPSIYNNKECFLYMHGKKPALIFKTLAKNFIKPDGRLNIYKMEDKTIDELNSSDKKKQLTPIITEEPIKKKEILPSEPKSFCEIVSENNQQIWLSPKEKAVFNKKGDRIIIGHAGSRWKIDTKIKDNKKGTCTLIKLTPDGKEVPNSQIIVDISSYIDESGIIKPHPLYEAVKLAQNSLSNDIENLEPKIEIDSSCDTSQIAEDTQDDKLKNLTYDTCTKKNNYLEKLLKKNSDQKYLSSYNEAKACIRIALMKSPGKKKNFPFCDSNKTTQSNLYNKTIPCISNNYVSFVYKVLDETAECFENITTQELLPLLAHESRFHLNVANTNKASGMFQVTKKLLDDEKSLKKVKTKKSSKCEKLKSLAFDGTVSGSMNSCERTAIPDGVKKTAYFAVAKLSKAKKHADSLLKSFDKNKLISSDIEIIQLELMWLMHNRGIGGVENIFDNFLQEFVKASESVKKSKKRKGLEKMWDEITPNQKFSRDTFIKFFSSFMYYERKGKINENNIKELVKLKKQYDTKYKSQLISLRSKLKLKNKKIANNAKRNLKKLENNLNKKINKYSTKIAKRAAAGKKFTYDKFFKNLSVAIHTMREYEGGTYAYAISCMQDTIERDAKKNFELDLTCGTKKLTQKRLNEIQISGIPPKCDHYRLRKILQNTLGSDYTHIR